MARPNCSKGKIDHCTSAGHLFLFLFTFYNLACIGGNFSSLCLATEVFPLINMYITCIRWAFFIFSDLLTIDEKLFSSNCPPLDALPLYLSHFQFIESSEAKVKLSFRIISSALLSVFFSMKLGVHVFLLPPLLITASVEYSDTRIFTWVRGFIKFLCRSRAANNGRSMDNVRSELGINWTNPWIGGHVVWSFTDSCREILIFNYLIITRDIHNIHVSEWKKNQYTVKTRHSSVEKFPVVVNFRDVITQPLMNPLLAGERHCASKVPCPRTQHNAPARLRLWRQAHWPWGWPCLHRLWHNLNLNWNVEQISSGVLCLGKYGEQSVHTVQPCYTGGWIKERQAGFNLDSQGGGNQSADTCTE